eukprot:752766-Hanusia_phi.AAC.1
MLRAELIPPQVSSPPLTIDLEDSTGIGRGGAGAGGEEQGQGQGKKSRGGGRERRAGAGEGGFCSVPVQEQRGGSESNVVLRAGAHRCWGKRREGRTEDADAGPDRAGDESQGANEHVQPRLDEVTLRIERSRQDSLARGQVDSEGARWKRARRLVGLRAISSFNAQNLKALYIKHLLIS